MLAKRGVVVEIGCGKGQLTIPLAVKMPGVHIIGVDSFKGSYRRSRGDLVTRLSKQRMRGQVKLEVSDWNRWFQTQPDSKYDAVISSEFLPELNSASLREFLVNCHRIIRSGGHTVHSFLSPQPRNLRQRRLVEADSDPKWTKTPPAEWFSPAPKRVMEFLKTAGFKQHKTARLRSGLVIRSLASKQTLREWAVRRSYWISHRTELEDEGLEVPDWIIIGAQKLG